MTIKLKTTIPGPNSQALMQRRNAHVARGPFHATPIFVKRAHGASIEDVDGNIFIDFASGIGVVNVGHTPHEVTTRIKSQADKLIHGSFNITPYESYIQVCEKLNAITPGDFPKKSFLTNSGAEAVENAVKIARSYTKRKTFICFEHAFHGRTYMAMALTAKEKPYKEGFGPFPESIIRCTYPYCYRWQNTMDTETVTKECFEQFKNQCTQKIQPNEIAAVIIEPVLGEGGFVVAPPAFLALLREFCDQHGIVLIVDEIQTGFGRTGKMFACETQQLIPDLIVTGKGLAAGMPLAAVTGKAEIMDAPEIGGIGGTYNGNPLSCEAALAVFDIFEKNNLLARAEQIGTILEAHCQQWVKQFLIVGETRGLGLMRAIELVKDRESKEPFPEAAKALIQFAYEHGVIIFNAGTFSNVIRFLIPLVIELADLEAGLQVIERGLKRY